jgi:hypothetical protein
MSINFFDWKILIGEILLQSLWYCFGIFGLMNAYINANLIFLYYYCLIWNNLLFYFDFEKVLCFDLSIQDRNVALITSS